ncbi:MAG TPA: hypothetical protein VLS48_09180, partial [Anaerolineales bacterium]|nr:hypothetical protein [Anaerolineales bacterium]
MQSLIQREIELHRQNGNGRLIFKMNSLVDAPMIRDLYEASQAGVQVDLIVRGICCLRPGIPGVSENIRVRSIVGRFLEHSRLYYFHNNGQPEIFMGSADLMPRNINRRVEVLFPVRDPRLINYLHDGVLATSLADNVKARIMQPDGSYIRLAPKKGEEPVSAQNLLIHRERFID